MKFDKKIIFAIVLAVVAVAVILYQFKGVIPSSPPSTKGAVSAQTISTPTAGSTISSAAMVQAATTPQDSYDTYIASVKDADIAYGSKGFRNPMKPLVSDPEPDKPRASGPAANVTVGPTDALSKGYTIEGIVWNEVQPLALVNEQVVSVGERLNDGALITEITPDTVRFTKNGYEYYLVFREE